MNIRCVVCGFIAMISLGTASAETLKLVLIPVRTHVKPGSYVPCDLYLHNLSSRAEKVPSLGRWSAIFGFEKRLSVRGGERIIGGASDLSDEPVQYHLLRPKSVEHRRITIPLKGKEGDFATISVMLKGKPQLESNSVTVIWSSRNR